MSKLESFRPSHHLIVRFIWSISVCDFKAPPSFSVSRYNRHIFLFHVALYSQRLVISLSINSLWLIKSKWKNLLLIILEYYIIELLLLILSLSIPAHVTYFSVHWYPNFSEFELLKDWRCSSVWFLRSVFKVSTCFAGFPVYRNSGCTK